ncbi:Beclin-1-like protein [Platanthera zijinensis]|uniref:Beclin-1-like protein n=1 Tax=Platanthera zijinensis TaxID=2320716 RepID=A0AAP0AY44_9ASPA
MQGSSIQGSMLSSTQMDHSFVILSKQKALGLGVPTHPRSALSRSENNPLAKGMEESFVVLPHAAASMYKCLSTSEGDGANSTTPVVSTSPPLQANNNGFHSSITILKRAFDITTSQTQVEQPLCLECMRILSDKLDEEVEGVNMDIETYEAFLKRSELDCYDVHNDADFLKEKAKVCIQ